MEHGIFRSDKLGHQVGKSLIFVIRIDRIRDTWILRPKNNGMWEI